MKVFRKPVRILLPLVVSMLLLGWLLSRLEEALTYHPSPYTGLTPAGWGIEYEELRLRTPDGQTLHGWWCPQREETAPRLLFFHGNAGNREHRLENVAALWRAGISVLIFDYRGYGGSSGKPSEDGLLADGLTAYDWLAARQPGAPVALFGRSLGGAVAAAVALRRPAAGLILESTFTSAADMAQKMLPFPGVRRITRARYDVLAAVRALTMPLLVIHGTADELVPFAMGERLFDAAAAERKQFRAVPGGRHNDTYLRAGKEYLSWIDEFLKNLPPRPPE